MVWHRVCSYVSERLVLKGKGNTVLYPSWWLCVCVCVYVCVFVDGLVSFLRSQVFAHALVMMERRARQCHKGIVGAVLPPGYVSPRWDKLPLTRSDAG